MSSKPKKSAKVEAASRRLSEGWARSASASWPMVRIGNALTLINGRAFKPSEWKDSGLPIVRIQNLNNPEMPFNYYKGDLPGKFLLNTGDLLFAWSGTPGTSFGAHIWQRGKAWLNQHIFKVEFSESQFDKRFLQLAINQNLQEYIRAAHGAAGLAHITKGRFEESEILCPPLPDQRRIVAEIEKQFTRLDAGVSALKRTQANLKRYRAAVLKAACEGCLVPTEAALHKSGSGVPPLVSKLTPQTKRQDAASTFETGEQLLARILREREKNWQGRGKYKSPFAPDTANLPPLPEGWAWANIEQLAAPERNSITDGPFGSNLKTEHYVESGPRVIRLQNIGDGVYIDEEAHITESHFERLQKHRVFSNDIVIAGFGENPPRSCIIPKFLGPAIVKADCIRFKPHTSILSKYLNTVLNSEPIRKRTKGMVHGIGRPRLNLGEIKSIIVPIPSLTEQTRIVSEVERRLSIIDEIETLAATNLAHANRLRQSILKTHLRQE
jgi:type I restriction enzyme S subunit